MKPGFHHKFKEDIFEQGLKTRVQFFFTTNSSSNTIILGRGRQNTLSQ